MNHPASEFSPFFAIFVSFCSKNHLDQRNNRLGTRCGPGLRHLPRNRSSLGLDRGKTRIKGYRTVLLRRLLIIARPPRASSENVAGSGVYIDTVSDPRLSS